MLSPLVKNLALLVATNIGLSFEMISRNKFCWFTHVEYYKGYLLQQALKIWAWFNKHSCQQRRFLFHDTKSVGRIHDDDLHYKIARVVKSDKQRPLMTVKLILCLLSPLAAFLMFTLYTKQEIQILKLEIFVDLLWLPK